MKVSLNWVKKFTNVNLSIEELVQKIGSQLGAIEEVIDLGLKISGHSSCKSSFLQKTR